jgi:hypothetical protein
MGDSISDSSAKTSLPGTQGSSSSDDRVQYKNRARRPSVDADAFKMVREAFQRIPGKPTSLVIRASANLPLSCAGSLPQAYKIQAVQALRPDDRLCRKEFAVEILDRIGNDSGFLDSHF